MTTALYIPSVPDAAGESPPVSQAVMDVLSARVRPGNVFLVLLRPDGTVVYADPDACPFFQRYALPLLQHGDTASAPMRDQIAALTNESPVAVWNALPGIVITAIPCTEQRKLRGVLLLAAKSPSFKLGEDVVRVCGKLGLDAVWLTQQAEELPALNEESMRQKGTLLLSMLRDQIRLAVLEGELDNLSGQLSNTYEELTLIYQLSGGMKVNRSARDFFKQACLDVMGVMEVRGMGVALVGDGLAPQPAILYGAANLRSGAVQRLADELMTLLRERKSPLLIPSLAKDKQFNWLAEYAQQLLAVPLMRQDQVLGCMFGIDKAAGDFDTVDSKLLNSIANESAIYLENAMLFEDARGLMMGLLHSLTSAVDAKDAYTCGHSERVAELSRHLARAAGLTDSQVERIYMAGLLHDVGKIGVPEGVLQKTGRLTTEEFEQMKKHPAIGAKILKDIRQIEDMVPGVLHHHERFDGKGYPAGLSGESIPLMGRIICLADCFDAMTSNRTYRKALPLEVALIEIRRCSGTQFDPKLTDAFLSLGEEHFRQVLNSTHERAAQLAQLQEVRPAA